MGESPIDKVRKKSHVIDAQGQALSDMINPISWYLLLHYITLKSTQDDF